jgi:hypothetical protein
MRRDGTGWEEGGDLEQVVGEDGGEVVEADEGEGPDASDHVRAAVIRAHIVLALVPGRMGKVGW